MMPAGGRLPRSTAWATPHHQRLRPGQPADGGDRRQPPPPQLRLRLRPCTAWEQDADLGVSTIAYDPAGNKIGWTDPRPASAVLGYDAANRLTTETFSDGVVHTYAYDKVNNPVSMTDPTGVTSRTFSVRNELLSEKTPLPMGGSGTVTSAYDPASRRTLMAAPRAHRHLDPDLHLFLRQGQPPDAGGQRPGQVRHHHLRQRGAEADHRPVQRGQRQPGLRRGGQCAVDRQHRPGQRLQRDDLFLRLLQPAHRRGPQRRHGHHLDLRRLAATDQRVADQPQRRGAGGADLQQHLHLRPGRQPHPGDRRQRDAHHQHV